jgi:hypothetical protein
LVIFQYKILYNSSLVINNVFYLHLKHLQEVVVFLKLKFNTWYINSKIKQFMLAGAGAGAGA